MEAELIELHIVTTKVECLGELLIDLSVVETYTDYFYEL
jgi:hypothetical protein